MSIALEGTIEIVRANVKLVRTRLGMTVLQFAKAVNFVCGCRLAQKNICTDCYLEGVCRANE